MQGFVCDDNPRSQHPSVARHEQYGDFQVEISRYQLHLQKPVVIQQYARVIFNDVNSFCSILLLLRLFQFVDVSSFTYRYVTEQLHEYLNVFHMLPLSSQDLNMIEHVKNVMQCSTKIKLRTLNAPQWQISLEEMWCVPSTAFSQKFIESTCHRICGIFRSCIRIVTL